MYTVEIRDENSSPISTFQYFQIGEAKRVAKDGAKHHGGSAVITDEEDIIVRDYHYEGNGKVVGYDDLGNAVENV